MSSLTEKALTESIRRTSQLMDTAISRLMEINDHRHTTNLTGTHYDPDGIQLVDCPDPHCVAAALIIRAAQDLDEGLNAYPLPAIATLN